MRVFLDTNVIISGFATRGLCADLIRVVVATHELVIGECLLDELKRNLARKLRMNPALVREIDAYVRSQAVEIVTDAPPLAVAGLDLADQRVLSEAMAGRAELFVTGDAVLLAAALDLPVRVVNPRTLWELLSRGEGGIPRG